MTYCRDQGLADAKLLGHLDARELAVTNESSRLFVEPVPITLTDVLLLCDKGEVVCVDAKSDATKMVDLKIVWNQANFQFVDVAMSSAVPPVNEDSRVPAWLAVAGAHRWSRPHMAGRLVAHLAHLVALKPSVRSERTADVFRRVFGWLTASASAKTFHVVVRV